MNRKALGKGIKALIPDFEMGVAKEETEDRKKAPVELLIEEIRPNRNQPRKHFDDEKLGELVASIREHGIIQPVVVQKTDAGYELIVGERRWRASRQAGLKKIPVVIREASSTQSLALALIENIHRQDLNPIEEATAFQQLLNEFGLTQEAVAQQVGRNRASVANYLRLLKLPRALQDDLASGRLSMGHARALLALEPGRDLMALRDEIIKKDLNVRQVENRVRILVSATAKTPKAGGKKRSGDVFTRNLETELERKLGTQVRLHAGKKGGRLVITYYSADDLDRLVRLLKK
jgi:ParB family chromosome partitioning protein